MVFLDILDIEKNIHQEN